VGKGKGSTSVKNIWKRGAKEKHIFAKLTSWNRWGVPAGSDCKKIAVTGGKRTSTKAKKESWTGGVALGGNLSGGGDGAPEGVT